MRDRRAVGDVFPGYRVETSTQNSGAQHSDRFQLRRSSPLIPAMIIYLMILCVLTYMRLDADSEPIQLSSAGSKTRTRRSELGQGDWTEFPVANPGACDDEDIIRFVQNNGGNVGPIAFDNFEMQGGAFRRGLAATARMKSGQTAVSIPLNLTLSLYTAVEDPRVGPELLQQVLLSRERDGAGIDEFSALAAFVLREAANASSFFRPFLCSLPRHVPLPIFETPDALNASGFASTGRYLRAVEVMGKVMADNYVRTCENLFDRRRDLFPTRPSLGAWLWASSIVFSRSWGVRPPPAHPIVEIGRFHSVHALAPLADMVNHDQASRKVVHSEDGGFAVVAPRDLAPGDEVTISYGDKCNMELLAHYGFALDRNPTGACEWDGALAKRLVQSPAQAAAAGAGAG